MIYKGSLIGGGTFTDGTDTNAGPMAREDRRPDATCENCGQRKGLHFHRGSGLECPGQVADETCETCGQHRGVHVYGQGLECPTSRLDN